MASGHVLVVEDPLVRRLIDGILTRDGFQVVEAEPARALSLLQDEGQNITLLVTNQPQLFLNFCQKVALLYVSAYPEPSWLERFPRCRALPKPFHPLQLVAAARELVDKP